MVIKIKSSLMGQFANNYNINVIRLHLLILQELEKLNSHIHLDLDSKGGDFVRAQRWKVLQAKRKMKNLLHETDYGIHPRGVLDSAPASFQMDYVFNTNNEPENEFEFTSSLYDGAYGIGHGFKTQDHYAKVSTKALQNFGGLSSSEKHEFYYAFTRGGFKEAMRTGRLPDGSELVALGNGKYRDRHGIVRDQHGPFWPPDYGPLYPAPQHRCPKSACKIEPLTTCIQGK